MRRAHAWLASSIVAWAAAACTLLSPLDYLTEGGPLVEGGTDVVGDVAADVPTAPPPPAADTFATAQVSPDFVAVDAATVFWHVGRAPDGGAQGAILAMPKAGGAAQILALTSATIGQLTVDADPSGFLYWSDGALVRRARKQGGDGGSDVVVTGQYPLNAFALDGTTFFTAESDPTAVQMAIARVDSDGGRVVFSDQDDSPAIVIAGPNVWWATTSPGTGQSEAHGLPRTTTTDGGSIVVLAKSAFDPSLEQSAAGDDQQLYWSDPTSINRHNLLPNGSTIPLYTDQDGSASFGDISVDAKYVWFTDVTNGLVLRLAKAGTGGEPEIRARGYVALTGIVSDGTNVYFVEQGTGAADGKILRIPAP